MPAYFLIHIFSVSPFVRREIRVEKTEHNCGKQRMLENSCTLADRPYICILHSEKIRKILRYVRYLGLIKFPARKFDAHIEGVGACLSRNTCLLRTSSRVAH